MKILIVAATYSEIAPLIEFYKCAESGNYFYSSQKDDKEISILITGVGMTGTAFYMGKILSGTKYDYAFNFGIAGAFNRNIKIGDVVNITTDVISELGAENKNEFLRFDEMNMSSQTMVRTAYAIENKNEISLTVLSEMFRAKGITVNTVHGNKTSIENIQNIFSPDIESMEGAAFLLACIHENMKCAQIRSISNYVEERNTENWNTKLAIHNLNEVALKIINSL